ncbi:hypothetical protein [Nostoc sp.]|uniref:hypothetical protein n=1 Tax=Nostoc sp. TaxID=1180 RepID=UPI002FF6D228
MPKISSFSPAPLLPQRFSLFLVPFGQGAISFPSLPKTINYFFIWKFLNQQFAEVKISTLSTEFSMKSAEYGKSYDPVKKLSCRQCNVVVWSLVIFGILIHSLLIGNLSDLNCIAHITVKMNLY